VDLEALLDQTQGKMQSVSVLMNEYSEAIQEYRETFDQTLSVITDMADSAKQSINENRSLISQLTDAIGSLGAEGNAKIDELDQKLGEFTERAQSIDQEITTAITSYAETLQANTQSAIDSSQNLVSTSTEYADLIQTLEDNFSNSTSVFDQLKDVILDTIGATVETTEGGLGESVGRISSLKDLFSTNATELMEKFKSMAEVSESLSQDLLDETTTLNGDKLALLESLIGSEIVGKILDGSGSLKDAAEALSTLGLDDIENYSEKISEVLEFTDTIQDIYSPIKELVDLV
jgi:methyl-accepting chemotaxis protein